MSYVDAIYPMQSKTCRCRESLREEYLKQSNLVLMTLQCISVVVRIVVGLALLIVANQVLFKRPRSSEFPIFCRRKKKLMQSLAMRSPKLFDTV